MIPSELAMLALCLIALSILLTHSYTKFQTWKERACFTGTLILGTLSIYTAMLTANLLICFNILHTEIFYWEMLSVAICVVFFQQLVNLVFVSFQFLKKGTDGYVQLVKALKMEVMTSIFFFVIGYIGMSLFGLYCGMDLKSNIIISLISGSMIGSILGIIQFVFTLE